MIRKTYTVRETSVKMCLKAYVNKIENDDCGRAVKKLFRYRTVFQL